MICSNWCAKMLCSVPLKKNSNNLKKTHPKSQIIPLLSFSGLMWNGAQIFFFFYIGGEKNQVSWYCHTSQVLLLSPLSTYTIFFQSITGSYPDPHHLNSEPFLPVAHYPALFNPVCLWSHSQSICRIWLLLSPPCFTLVFSLSEFPFVLVVLSYLLYINSSFLTLDCLLI